MNDNAFPDHVVGAFVQYMTSRMIDRTAPMLRDPWSRNQPMQASIH